MQLSLGASTDLIWWSENVKVSNVSDICKKKKANGAITGNMHCARAAK